MATNKNIATKNTHNNNYNTLPRGKDLWTVQYFVTCLIGAQHSGFTKKNITHKQMQDPTIHCTHL